MSSSISAPTSPAFAPRTRGASTLRRTAITSGRTSPSKRRCAVGRTPHGSPATSGEVVLGELLPSLQGGIAAILNLPDPRTIAIAPNTHEFLRRILSCFPAEPRPFASSRPTPNFTPSGDRWRALRKTASATCTYVPAEPSETLPGALRRMRPRRADTISCSCPRSSSRAAPPAGRSKRSSPRCPTARPSSSSMAITASWRARPTCRRSRLASSTWPADTSTPWQGKASASCIVHPAMDRARATPAGSPSSARSRRPPGKTVGYPADGSRFLGATFDPVGMYRMRAVLTWMAASGIGITQVHAHATALMAHFLERLEPLAPERADAHATSSRRSATVRPTATFSAFRTPHAAAIERALAAVDIQADHRGDRMRFGFGLAITREEVDAAIARMAQVLATL